jgi:hypothetical protein
VASRLTSLESSCCTLAGVKCCRRTLAGATASVKASACSARCIKRSCGSPAGSNRGIEFFFF